jgi:dihydropteroate synthase
MNRRHFVWKFRDRELLTGERTLIMGVLNVTPDSFSDGGKYLEPDRAFARAIELEEQGADVIDIGAESTRPGAERVSEAEELRRLIPVLKRLHGKLAVPISVDTYKSAVAEKSLEHGAEIINDPSGLTFDAQLARVAANHNAGLIINHMRGTPETWAKLPPLKDVIGAIRHDLDAAVHRAVRSGSARGSRSTPALGSESAESRMPRFWRDSTSSPLWRLRSWWARPASRFCRKTRKRRPIPCCSARPPRP